MPELGLAWGNKRGINGLIAVVTDEAPVFYKNEKSGGGRGEAALCVSRSSFGVSSPFQICRCFEEPFQELLSFSF